MVRVKSVAEYPPGAVHGQALRALYVALHVQKFNGLNFSVKFLTVGITHW
jgi:hypothetical protein